MELHFTPEQAARIEQLALHESTSAEQLVVATIIGRLAEDDVLRPLHANSDYQAAVARGIEAAEKGELVEHSEVVETIERMLRS